MSQEVYCQVMTTDKDTLVVASRTKRFWAFAIDQTIISVIVFGIFIAIFATQTAQLTHLFNVLFGDPIWQEMQNLPRDEFQARLAVLLESASLSSAVAALAHPFALAVTLSLVFEAAYYIIPTTRSGATLGKKWLHMKVHTIDGEDFADWTHSSIRYFVFLGLGTFSGIVAVLDLFVNKSFEPSNVAVEALTAILSQVIWILTVIAIVMICTRPDRRGLHDILARTIVHDVSKKK